MVLSAPMLSFGELITTPTRRLAGRLLDRACLLRRGEIALARDLLSVRVLFRTRPAAFDKGGPIENQDSRSQDGDRGGHAVVGRPLNGPPLV